MKIRVGDTVKVLSGEDRGKTGKVTAVHRKTMQVTVDGVHLVRRHRKATQKVPQGGIVEETRPIAMSKVTVQGGSSKAKTAKKAPAKRGTK